MITLLNENTRLSNLASFLKDGEEYAKKLSNFIKFPLPPSVYKSKKAEAHSVRLASEDNPFRNNQKIRGDFKTKYGVEHPSQVPEIKERIRKNTDHAKRSEKIKETNQKRYGGSPAKTEAVRNKIKATHLAKTKEEVQSADAKAVETNRKKYGVDRFTHLESSREQMSAFNKEHREEMDAALNATSQQKYGTDYPIQDPQIKAKFKKSLFDKYGVHHTLDIPGIRTRINDTKIAKYGHAGMPKTSESAPEKEIKSLFSKFNPQKKYIDGCEFDICFEQQKLLIEFNGTWWHREDIKGQSGHLKKTLVANENGYRLIHIFSPIWKHRKTQMIDFIRSKLGDTSRVYARKCKIAVVSGQEAKSFCDVNHIQKGCNSVLAVGLWFQDKLVSVMCFSMHPRNNEQITLSRFCSTGGVTVVGGFSRLEKFAFEILKDTYKEVITWADRSISEGAVYSSNGWIQDAVLRPDYFYVKNEQVISKQSRRKSVVNTPEGMTETQHAQIDKLVRIWDCGKIRFKKHL